MRSKTSRILLALAISLAAAGSVAAQEGAALIELLKSKGILTEQEAEDLRADLAKENAAATVTTSRTPNLERLGLSGRVQAQFVNLDTNIDGAADPATARHAFLRRIYLGWKPQFGNNWSANVNYDFAGSTFDAAYLQWIQSPAFTLQAGFKKAPIGYEEYFISSGALKSIERSPATRFFVEANNGRRLGAGSYRQGLWASGKQGDLSYEVAITNPEREESASGVTGTGSSANNTFAYWGNLNYGGKFAEGAGSYKFGASVGFLPDQGGKTLGVGDDLTVWSAYGDLRYGDVSLMGEYWGSSNERGVSASQDAGSWGYWIQPSYRFGAYEAVFRYSYVDSDGRGVQTSDGIRSAPSGGTMDKLWECFGGLNWYIVGNEAKHEVKLQAGYVYGESSDLLTGVSASATSQGFRTQLQVNF